MNCGGITVKADDIVVADMDGVAVVPREHAEDVLKKAQQLDESEPAFSVYRKPKSIREAVAKFGRL